MPSEDIKNLFSRFGNRSGRYHEIVREDQRTDSVGRWPLLSAVKVGEVRSIPGVSVREPQRVLDLPQASGIRPFQQASGEGPSPVLTTPVSPLAAVGHKHLAPAAGPAVPVDEKGGGALFGFGGGVRSGFPAPAAAEPKVETLGFSWGAKVPVASVAPLMAAKPDNESTQALREVRVGVASLASTGDRTLKSVFGRLGGLPLPSQDDSDALRAVPIFRRLRRP